MNTKGDNAEACDISETQKNEKAPVFFCAQNLFSTYVENKFCAYLR